MPQLALAAARSPATSRVASTRDRLVTANLRLVYAIANDMHHKLGRNVPADDLVGYGSIGLIEAAERFDPNSSTPFGTFARYRIRGAMLDGIRASGLRYTRLEHKRLVIEQRVNLLLEQGAAQDDGRPSSVEDAVEYLYDVLTKIGRIHTITSVDSSSRDYDPDFSEGAPEESESTGNRWNGHRLPSQPIEAVDVGPPLADALNVLPPNERRVVELCDLQGKTLVHAARELGIGKPWACRLRIRALARMREVMGDDVNTRGLAKRHG